MAGPGLRFGCDRSVCVMHVRGHVGHAASLEARERESAPGSISGLRQLSKRGDAVWGRWHPRPPAELSAGVVRGLCSGLLGSAEAPNPVGHRNEVVVGSRGAARPWEGGT